MPLPAAGLRSRCDCAYGEGQLDWNFRLRTKAAERAAGAVVGGEVEVRGVLARGGAARQEGVGAAAPHPITVISNLLTLSLNHKA